MHLLRLPHPPVVNRETRPVSVCFVIDRLSRAGTETQLLALIRQFDRNRVRPSLCLLNGDDPESRELLPADCPTLVLRLGRMASLAAPGAATRLAAFWRRNRVDVVQTYFLDSGYFAVPLARLCGIPPGQARDEMHGLGQPDAQYQGLERSMLLDHRHPP